MDQSHDVNFDHEGQGPAVKGVVAGEKGEKFRENGEILSQGVATLINERDD
jgi:hypothetical protein